LAKRIFSYDEAVALLPEVRRVTEEAWAKVEALGPEAASGPARPQLEQVVQEWAQTLLEQGMEVKGLWLVDFDNGSGYYCWQYPESSLQFFHSYEDGFQGRMRIQ
jgi:hypothetical protein